MEIRCLQFGPVVDGSINLNKDLLILCGKNSSGKSYVSYILYDLLNQQLSASALPEGLQPFLKIEELKITETKDSFEPRQANFRINLAKLMLTQKQAVEAAFSIWIKYRLPFIFPDSTSFEKTRFEVSLPYDRFIQEKEMKQGFSSFITMNVASKLEENSPVDQVHIRYQKPPGQPNIYFTASHTDKLSAIELSKGIIDMVHIIILNVVLINSQSNTLRKAYYFPSERIALDVFRWDIIEKRSEFNSLIQKRFMIAGVERAGYNESGGKNFNPPFQGSIDPDLDKFYPLPIRDFILRSGSYSSHNFKKSELYEYGVELEKTINAVLNIDDPKLISSETDHVSLPLKLTSSTVKSLASFILYLKYEASRFDVVLFDEPELSLHPALQRKLAVILAKLVRKGIKLIMATHSDFMLREFNNLIMLFPQTEPAKKLRIKYEYLGYRADATLDPTNVGISLFGDGVIVDAPVTAEGFDVSSIDKEIAEQSKISEDIYFSLF